MLFFRERNLHSGERFRPVPWGGIRDGSSCVLYLEPIYVPKCIPCWRVHIKSHIRCLCRMTDKRFILLRCGLLFFVQTYFNSMLNFNFSYFKHHSWKLTFGTFTALLYNCIIVQDVFIHQILNDLRWYRKRHYILVWANERANKQE